MHPPGSPMAGNWDWAQRSASPPPGFTPTARWGSKVSRRRNSSFEETARRGPSGPAKRHVTNTQIHNQHLTHYSDQTQPESEPASRPSSEELARWALDAALDKKALEPVLLDVRA